VLFLSQPRILKKKFKILLRHSESTCWSFKERLLVKAGAKVYKFIYPASPFLNYFSMIFQMTHYHFLGSELNLIGRDWGLGISEIPYSC
jgi:hypothetical protein